jgi:tRNA (guanine-N7-)-methyltransferase
MVQRLDGFCFSGDILWTSIPSDDVLFSVRFCTVMDANPSSLFIDMDPSDESDPVLAWPRVFGNDHPVELEIGIGKGRFLLDAAARRPATNFIGIEWAGKYLRLAVTRSCRRDLDNIRFAKADAREFVEFLVPSASVQVIYVLFPDPWPKARHHKRRLINAAFIAEVERVLQPGGRLWLATDHMEYFEAMCDVLAVSDILRPVAAEWTGARTNYEEKYLTQGKPINRRMVEKGA